MRVPRAPPARAPIQPTRLLIDALAFVLLQSRVGPGLQLGYDVDIRPSPGRGSGAFALRDIPAGAFVGRYAGAMYSTREYARLKAAEQVSGAYAFGAGGDWLVDAEDASSSSWHRFINHSRRRPNLVACVAYWWFGPLGIVYFCATRDIRRGDELFFDYGDEYWDVRVKRADVLSRLKIDLA